MDRIARSLTLMSLTIAAGSALAAPPIAKRAFGTTKEGKEVELYTLTNRNGASVSLMTRGATLTRLVMPDRNGTMGDVALGFDELAPYEGDSGYMGAVAGRFANRIANGRFKLDGKSYKLPINNGPNSLHGGTDGFDRRIWKATPKDTSAGPSITFTMRDPEGANGYPGAVDASVKYTLTHSNTLKIEYEARSTRATPINLTQHAYFNLRDAGAGPVGSHVLQIMADRYLPVNANTIPTGRLAPVAGTPIDFRKPKPIGQDLAKMGANPAGYDHNMVLRGANRKGVRPFSPAVIVSDPDSGRRMEMWTDQPGVQLYTGNFLGGTLTGRDGAKYGQYHGFCLEAQAFPDAPNQSAFPNSILRPGKVYRQRTEYRFSAR